MSRLVAVLVAGLLLLPPLTRLDSAIVVNGVLVVPVVTAPMAAVIAAWWALIVTVGCAALADVPRPMLRAIRSLPAALPATLIGLPAWLLPRESLAFVLLAAACAAAAGVLAIAVPVALVEEKPFAESFIRAVALLRGRSLSTGGALVLGLVVPALAAGWLLRVLTPDSFALGLAASFLTSTLLFALAVLQVNVLFGIYRHLVNAQVPERPGRSRVLVAVAILLVPTALQAAIMGSGRLTEVTRSADLPLGRLMEVAWPAGRGPVLVGQSEILDCLDDPCYTFTKTPLRVHMFHPSGSAVVAPDGTVYALGQHELQRCDPQRRCERQDGMLEVLRGSYAESMALAPDGDLLIATVKPVADRDVEVGMIRCRDVFCVDPQTVSFGRAGAPLASHDRKFVNIVVDEAGLPAVAYRPPPGGAVWIGRCATEACDGASLRESTDVELASMGLDRLLDCSLDICGVAGRTRELTTLPQGGRVGVQTQTVESGLLLQTSLMVCPGGNQDCRPIKVHESRLAVADPQWLAAVNPDGRVLLVPGQSLRRQVITVRL